MIKGLVTWFLNNYLGKYLENLNTDQLTIALLQGEVELENVPIRKDALRSIDPILDVQSGFVGQIKLKIPVIKMHSEPWSILLKHIYIIVGPQQFQDYDEETDENNILNNKLVSLDLIDAEWKHLVDIQNESNDAEYSSWMYHGSSFVGTIIENLQIKIEDVHIRYENVDSYSASGFCIESLAVHTCDENWIPTFMYRNPQQNYTFKIVELTNMSFYFCSISTPEEFYSHLSKQEMTEKLKSISKSHFILKSVSATAKLKRHVGQRLEAHLSKCIIDLQLPSIAFQIMDSQYRGANTCIRSLSQLRRNQRVWKWRPKGSIFINVSRWWKYAILVTLHRIRSQRSFTSWSSLLKLARQNVFYIKAYKAILLNPLNEEWKRVKDAADSERSYEELKILRELTLEQLKKESMSNSEFLIPKRKLTWYEWWYNLSPKDEEKNSEHEKRNLFFSKKTKDVISCQLGFSLVTGTITMISKSKEIIELQFDTTTLNIVSRSTALKFELKLGALYVKDKTFSAFSSFPFIVSPVLLESAGSSSQNVSQKYLFDIMYENSSESKLHIKTQSLQIVYSPNIIYHIQEFFKISEENNEKNQFSDNFKMAAWSRIDEAKQWTKSEFQRYYYFRSRDNDNENIFQNWNILFELSAPQIIIPESVIDKESLSIVVIDFGKLRFSNVNDGVSSSEDDDEEKFMTPASTPEELPNISSPVFDILSDKFYSIYSLTLSDMQILVAKRKENWKYAHKRGASGLHIFDKFTISLTLKKINSKLIPDSNWPSFLISGSLPKMNIHINEDKIFSLLKIIQLFSEESFFYSSSVSSSSSTNPYEKQTTQEENFFLSKESELFNSEPKEQFLYISFCVNDLSIELQSLSRSIVELQSTGVRVSFTKRFPEITCRLTVHSLLLVDALQTFGPNFELLLASHKNVTVDSFSGSLKGSEPVSPTSSSLSQKDIQDVFRTLKAFPSSVDKFNRVDNFDPDALISVEFVFVEEGEEEAQENIKIISVSFNSLDVIANQETIIEIISFIKRILPPRRNFSSFSRSFESLSENAKNTQSSAQSDAQESQSYNIPPYYKSRIELNAEFHRLNILLLRAVSGKMIGTALLTELKVVSTTQERVSASGSIGSIQIMNLLSSTNTLHQKILAIGKESLLEENRRSQNHLTDLYPGAVNSEALSFSIIQSSLQAMHCEIRMASVCYTHSPAFLNELNSCATDFKRYMRNLAMKIADAATEMALGIVNRQTELLSSFESCDSRTLESGSSFSLLVTYDVLLETPVLILPRNESSFEVLIAHLGEISFKNSCEKPQRFSLQIKEMNVQSLNLKDKYAYMDNDIAIAHIKQSKTSDVYYNKTPFSKAILHDTALDFTIDIEKNLLDEIIIIQIEGLVVSSLKISLVRSQYEQILESFDRTDYRQKISKYSIRNKMESIVKDETTQFFRGSFQIPNLILELQSNDRNIAGLVRLNFEDFKIFFENSSNLEIRLKSLVMEDLSVDKNSVFRILMNSMGQSQGFTPLNSHSSFSCPDLRSVVKNKYLFSSSLPNQLNEQWILGSPSSHNSLKYFSSHFSFPNYKNDTSNNTKKDNEKDMNLVNVKIHNSEEIQIVKVDFNTLDIHLNLNSWISVFEFFGFGSSTVHDSVPLSLSTKRHSLKFSLSPSSLRSTISVSIQSLNIQLNQKSFALARISANDYSCQISKFEDYHFDIQGKLGTFSLKDLTRHGSLYRDRFVLQEKDVPLLSFHYYNRRRKNDECNGNGSEDNGNEWDANLSLRMSSVIYVHTNRFYFEIWSFFTQFQISPIVFRDKKPFSFKKLQRISLDIEALSPIILLPTNSSSSDILVITLGKLEVINQLTRSAESSVIHSFHPCASRHRSSKSSQCSSSKRSRKKSENENVNDENESSFPNGPIVINTQCILDVIQISLSSLDVWIASRLSVFTENKSCNDIDVGGFYVRRLESHKLLKEKFELCLTLTRNLDRHLTRKIPDISIQGTISKVHVVLSAEQYKIIRGFLTFNLGEQFDEEDENDDEEDEDDDDEDNENSIKTGSFSEFHSEETWTTLVINVELQDVILDFYSDEDLSRINFFKSRVLYEKTSDFSVDIDLVSAEILLTDTRCATNDKGSSNAFTQILAPLPNSPQTILQAEIHYRSTRNISRFTILLNNMRLMGIFDWWTSFFDFICQNAPNPFSSSNTNNNNNINTKRNRKKMIGKNEEPLYPSSGVISRRSVILENEGPVFELNLNISDSEFVIVLDPSSLDSSTIILKSTTVIAYRPELIDKPFSCNCNNAQVFSCLLNDETSKLSIIDPLNINVEIRSKSRTNEFLSKGLNDFFKSQRERTAEIVLQQFQLRLSYYDCLMFQRIYDSFPLMSQIKSNSISQISHSPKIQKNKQIQEKELSLLFLEDFPKISFSVLEVKVSSLNLCIFDDSVHANVPLLEMNFSHLNFKSNWDFGECSTNISGSYYNRSLGSWEPFIEPWSLVSEWHGLLTDKLNIHLNSSDVLNVNLTSSMLEVWRSVKKNWSKCENKRSRTPFIPYAIQNLTGVELIFSTFVKSNPNGLLSKGKTERSGNEHTVCHGEILPFYFEEEFGKIRNCNSNDVKIHQLLVKLMGWHPLYPPLTIDVIGHFFREATPEIVTSNGLENESQYPPVRVVFDISLEGSARKLIKVRSALYIWNHLPYAIELRLDNSVLRAYEQMILKVESDERIFVPLLYVWASIYVRALREGEKLWKFSEKAIHWYHVVNKDESSFHECLSRNSEETERQRFFVFVQRLKYPSKNSRRYDEDDDNKLVSKSWIQPYHVISFSSPIVIHNLLPYHLMYVYKTGGMRCGDIKPGQCTHFSIDNSITNVFSFSLDTYPSPSDIQLHPPLQNDFEVSLKLYDTQGRPLTLICRLHVQRNGSSRLSIHCPFWILNNTGLPLIIHQEGLNSLASGQEETHEMARMSTPLLFSFEDEETGISIRVGKGCHPLENPEWCKHFYIQQQGVLFRKLRVGSRHTRTEYLYIIGIDIRRGTRDYDSTTIITLSPRFQFFNHSSNFIIEVAQKCVKDSSFLRLLPTSSISFHWSSVKEEQILVMRVGEMMNGIWSGGFLIDKIDSFTINVRDTLGKSIYFRVEVTLRGATFAVHFSEALNFPPPFRIDNHSLVSLTVHQVGVDDLEKRNIIKAKTSLPYALDEPNFEPLLTIAVPGGSSEIINLNSRLEDGVNEGSKCCSLVYDNFIYIAYTASFSGKSPSELVLDVKGSNVVLSRKEPGKRSQLWHYSSTSFLLHHEGSSPPQEFHVNKSPHYVLDIAGPAVQPNSFIALKLRKVDDRRSLTQKWIFTSAGTLTCQHSKLVVQVKDGFSGNEVVLGPYVGHFSELPPELGFSQQQLRPGSGVLSIRLTTDGPTRVLHIIDASTDKTQTEDKLTNDESNSCPSYKWEIVISLKSGIGISVVNGCPPEELCYVLCSNVLLDANCTEFLTTIDGSVQNLQINNQIFECQNPLILYLSPLDKNDGYRHMPALHFSLCREKSSLIKRAFIYRHFILTMKNITVNLEEEFICRILQWSGRYFNNESLAENSSFNKCDVTQYSSNLPFLNTSFHGDREEFRMYFGILSLTLHQIRLSVIKSETLNPTLKAIKKQLNLSLIPFEDAKIKLNSYIRAHSFETMSFQASSIFEHYRQELLGQAFLILGSTDFLGNPLGLLNDISEGLSGLIYQGNLTGLIGNLTHGAANTTAKFTGSLSYGISKLSLDERYDERRLLLRKATRDHRSKEHLIAGIKGLGFGVLGGVTSVLSETYDGLSNDGLRGFFVGLGWGLVGTVSKPAIGFLDLATGTAKAIKESSRSSFPKVPQRLRIPRVVLGPIGSMPIYNAQDALGQEKLYKMNGNNYDEIFIAYEALHPLENNLYILVSSRRMMVFSSSPSSDAVVKTVLTIYLNELRSATLFSEERRHYVEISLVGISKKPQIRCDHEDVAQRVCARINYAKSIYEELGMAVHHSMAIMTTTIPEDLV